ncbi:hypothetical protein HCA61_12520 [Rhodococcus sp. HNM0563]|uniref:hypothetical protein n=1 Tax=Rhodococcus sp. HNM0563 TaxID=2716339 RepID=UPI00146D961A|nr:hypothetical protein [Rhodococcus sp. HNM0563]NLU63085.1 hypothetical protein [Rhodococcus sp. HNM0563]
MAKLPNTLSEDEFVLIRETKKSQIAELTEDDLIDLHTRTRRARNKYVKLYRRSGAEKVGEKKSRASGRAANKRNAGKAELFEDALARVSRRLAKVARQSAQQLKEEQLALARSDSPVPSDGAGGKGKGKVKSEGKSRVDSTRDSSGRKKYEASTIAAGARRQVKKDKKNA